QAIVSNTGNVSLSSVTVNDANPVGTFTGTTTLASGASATYTGVSTTALAGLHTDTATASGTNIVTVTASDQANYLGVNPSIAIDKQIGFGSTFFDVGSNLDLKKVLVGTEVDFRAIVTNTTDQALGLTGVGVGDVNGPTLTSTITSLAQVISATLSGSTTSSLAWTN